ncbi:hypothetical protein VNO77_20006 [Canavalia gladiata]|uniref:Uncharacterized protein n=1 Tax=Canavalia gladiata TaxID=3824 RepID=A0AAN9LNJ3_CANGL
MNSSGYQQREQEQEQKAGYDPSQTLSYNQSSQPCYAYNYQYDNQPQIQHESTSVHPPGVPIAPEPPHSSVPSQTQQLNPVQVAPVAGSLNPAAVAVVAGALAQLVGNVDGLQRKPIGPSQYRGRGFRGGRPFRGISRGRFSHHRGRGRSRGGDGTQFPSHSSGPSISNIADAPAAGPTSEVQSSSISGQSPLPNLAQLPAAPMQAPPCKLWCEICKAECNTPEMMEQHKNGKRHKKNLLVHEELQRRKAINGQQSGNVCTSQSNLTIQPENVQESEKKGLLEENTSAEATADNRNDETELQHNVGAVSEVQAAEEPQEEPGDNSAIQGHSFKRKMRGGRAGKYMRSNDGSRKPVEPKQVTSFICELCNVKCDSQVVYNSHLTGKKHLSNFKRVHGYQALNGEAGIQPLHPPDINALSSSNNFPVQQGVSDPQVLLAQLLMTVLSRVQIPATSPLSVAAPIEAPTLVAGSNHEPLSQNLSQTQVSDSLAHFESENPATLQLDATAGTSNKSNPETADEKPVTETVLKVSQDSSVMTPTENPVAASEQVPSYCEAPSS